MVVGPSAVGSEQRRLAGATGQRSLLLQFLILLCCTQDTQLISTNAAACAETPCYCLPKLCRFMQFLCKIITALLF